MREGNFVAVGVGAIDVVEAHGVLRDHFERAARGFKDFGVNLIAQRGYQPIHAGADFVED